MADRDASSAPAATEPPGAGPPPPHPLAGRPFVPRFRAYLAERFPLGTYATLILLFAGAGQLVAQHLDGQRPLLLGPRAAAAFAVTLLAFGVLRFLDEFKDLDIDRVIHPERLVSRGVIQLRELGVAALIASALMLAVAAPLGLEALAWCAGILAMLVLLWREFFIPRLLGRSYAIYAAAHQLLHPALVGFAFASWVPPRGDALIAAGLYSAFAAFSFLAFDVGRKLVPPELERDGWETYSARYGMRAACGLAIALLAAASVSLGVLEARIGAASWTFAAVAVAWALSASGFVAFLRRPTARRADGLKNFASINMLLGFVIVAVELALRDGLALGLQGLR